MDLLIYRCGYEKKQCPWEIKQYESGGHYLFCYIVSGKGVLRVEKEKKETLVYTLSERMGFLVEPGKGKDMKVFPEGSWDFVWIEFGGLRAGEYTKLSGLTENQPVYMPEEPEQGDMLFQCMLELIKSGEECPLKMTGHLYLFMDCLVRTCRFKGQTTGGKNSETYVEGAVRYIEQNYSRHISVEELARRCWLDRSYFGKVFKSVTGQSPQQFLIRFRMEKAASELRTGNMPVGDVGTLVGYPNLLHFSRAFKGVYGMSPSDYRQKYRERVMQELFQ